MVPRTRLVVALLVVTLTAGCSLPFGGGDTGASLTVENQNGTAYRVTAYAIDDLPPNESFAVTVTTADGERTSLDVERLQSDVIWEGATYRNATPASGRSPDGTVSVRPHSNASLSVDDWTADDHVLYIVETADSERVGYVGLDECSNPSFEHTMVVWENASISAGYACS